MEKQLKYYLKFYLPVKVELDNGGSKVYNRMAVAVGNTDDDFTYITLRMGTGAKSFTHSVLFSENRIKPILRPLSSMTEDECLKIASFFGTGHLSAEAKIRSVKQLFESNGYYNKVTNLSGSQWNKIINYCRSICIDMDGLIEAGIALDHSTINQSDNAR